MGRVLRDSKIEKWERDLETIKNEVIGLHHNRDVYRTVGRIVDEHGHLPSSLFFNYAQRTYAVTQCAAIRRQAEVDPTRVVSLASLLAEISAEPERLTRERFAKQRMRPAAERRAEALRGHGRASLRDDDSDGEPRVLARASKSLPPCWHCQTRRAPALNVLGTPAASPVVLLPDGIDPGVPHLANAGEQGFA